MLIRAFSHVVVPAVCDPGHYKPPAVPKATRRRRRDGVSFDWASLEEEWHAYVRGFWSEVNAEI